MTDEKEYRWASSEDDERWSSETLGELLDEMSSDEDVQAGRTVYFGEVWGHNKHRFVPEAQWVIEHIADQAYDAGGEHADDYPEISDEGKQALSEALREWAEKHLPEPKFYNIKNVKPYVITVEDLE